MRHSFLCWTWRGWLQLITNGPYCSEERCPSVNSKLCLVWLWNQNHTPLTPEHKPNFLQWVDGYHNPNTYSHNRRGRGAGRSSFSYLAIQAGEPILDFRGLLLFPRNQVGLEPPGGPRAPLGPKNRNVSGKGKALVWPWSVMSIQESLVLGIPWKVQWLWLGAFMPRVKVYIPSWGTRIPHARQYSQKEKHLISWRASLILPSPHSPL